MLRLFRQMVTLSVHIKLFVTNIIKQEKICVCVPLKNRTPNVLEGVIASLNKCYFKNRIILSIFDCGSTDVDDLESTIRESWKGELVFNSEERDFSKTYSLNKAIDQAPIDRIFCCDADMTLPKDLVVKYDTCVGKGVVWFPIYFSLYKNKPQKILKSHGWWRTEGFGLMGVLKPDMKIIGGFDEKFSTWGNEDTEIAQRSIDRGMRFIRYNCWGLYHNWHPYGDWGGRDDEEIFEHIA